MSQTETIAPLELIVNRTFNAPRERVFRAWTEAAALNRWFAPAPGRTVESSLDVRVGGAYRIEMRNADGRVYISTGVYREVQPPARLVFTWNSVGGAEPVEDTLVTVEFFEAGDAGEKTQITLTHQNFGSAEMRNQHGKGWAGCLEGLEKELSA
ncbi:MAG: SRPBCC domain-containing protein [Acidobacteriaceae bacterium]